MTIGCANCITSSRDMVTVSWPDAAEAAAGCVGNVNTEGLVSLLLPFEELLLSDRARVG